MDLELRIGLDAISSYKRLAYTPWHAIAELVDNSTQSFFDHENELKTAYAKAGQSLEISITYDSQGTGIFRIHDNAMGMSYEELQNALYVARPPANTTGRSKYGMGLKTAASWMGNIWEVKTKKLGETVEHSVRIDVEQIAHGHNKFPDLPVDNKNSDLHYTIVEISELNRKFQGRTLGRIKDFLRSMYREDLRRNILTLLWQGVALTWEELDNDLLKDHDGKNYKKSFAFTVDGKSVKGWVAILLHGSRANAGFSIIHAGRVIRGWPDPWRPTRLYGQLQGSNNLVNQRLVGEIHLDQFDVSHTKDDILWIGDQEDGVENELLKACADYRDIAAKPRKGQEDERGPSEVETNAAVDELKKELFSPEMVDQINLEPVPPKDVVKTVFQTLIDSVVRGHEETFQGHIGELAVKLFLAGDLSPNDPYVLIEASQISQVIIIVNIVHPHWHQLKGSEGVLNYLRHCVYDGVAEWKAMAKASRIDPDTIKLLKDGLLRVPFVIERDNARSDEGNIA
jgi:Histidine kinase-, DNA gyrase B-, and HSP90-like ATPase